MKEDVYDGHRYLENINYNLILYMIEILHIKEGGIRSWSVKEKIINVVYFSIRIEKE